MRVESDIQSSGGIHTTGHDNLWPPPPNASTTISTPNPSQDQHPDSSGMQPSSHHAAFPLQVDPALQQPPQQQLHQHPLEIQHEQQEGGPSDHSPYLLTPAYQSGRPGSVTRARGAATSASSRARTDLLSPNAAALFRAATAHQPIQTQAAESGDGPPSPSSPTSATSASGVTRLPPILQVEKKTVTTSATQAASASRRRNEAMYQCPVPGCGSTFTRRFNLRGHLRSHTEERPYVCDWPGCGKGFARQHDCKRHYALHAPRPSSSHVCQGCGRGFSRTDALNRHLRSDNGQDCRMKIGIYQAANQQLPGIMHPQPGGLDAPNGPIVSHPGLDAHGLPAGPSTRRMNGRGKRTPSNLVDNVSASPSRSGTPM